MDKCRRGTEEMKMETLEVEELVSVEDVLEKLGGFSRFQIYIMFIILLSEVPVAAGVLSLIFTGTSKVEFGCASAAGNGLELDLEILSAKDPRICNRNCTFVTDPLEPVSSIVQEWELICEKSWLPDFLTSIQMMGMILGAVTGSQFADTFGRKTAFYTNVVIFGTFGLVSGLAHNVYLFGVSRFLAGIGLGGFYCVYFIYLMEFLTPKWRTIAGCVSIWSVGIMVMALLAYSLRSWRYVTCAPSIAVLTIIIFYPFVPETPRWLLCKERTAEAEKCLRQIAKMNRRPPLNSAAVESLQKSVLRDRKCVASLKTCSWEIFSNRDLRMKLLVFNFAWFTVSYVYYSMCFNVKNIGGDPYLNVLYMGLVDLVAWPSGALFNNRLGRRTTFAGYLVFSFIFLAVKIIMRQTYGHNVKMIAIISYFARFGIGGAWGVLTCFVAESFPTTCRTSAMGICGFSAYIGGFTAPLNVYIGTILPLAPGYAFAILTLATAMSVYFLEETNKKPLENFASRK